MSEPKNPEISNATASQFSTRRLTIPALEAILHTPQKILDHGFIRVIDYMGGDEAVVQAARVSYGRGTKHVSQDRALIRYLLRHGHTTPFEMCEIKLHIKLPIFVARQWIRHRMANVNEYSARYSIFDQEFYLPTPDQLAGQDHSNRQGRKGSIEHEETEQILSILRNDSNQAYKNYRILMNEAEDGTPLDPNRQGLTRELARMNLPINFYTQWYWKCDLHNLLRFVQLRIDPHAQYEIRAYAEILLGVIERWVPLCFEAFCDYRLHALSLSAPALAVVKRMLANETVDQETSGLGIREWRELMASLQSDTESTV